MEIVGENRGPSQNQSGGIPIDIVKNAEYIECENCGSRVFEEKMMIKKISKFMTGASQDQIVPMPVIACAQCSHVNELFKPQI
jgi:DNA-directed RNA polymerase subunit RPC12/RpoP